MKLLWALLLIAVIIPTAYAVTHIDDQTLTVENIIIGGSIYKGETLYTDYLLSIMPPGPQGPQGIQGEAGNNGSQGIQGIQGIQGPRGFNGTIGDTGIQGLKGDPGSQGIQGERGFNGTQGVQGEPGVDGVDGEDGAPGAKGDKGDTGLQGPVYTPPSLMQFNLFQAIPYTTTPTTLTPTAHAANVARVFSFELNRPITVNVVSIRTNGAVNTCLILGIFNATGAQMWQSGAFNTVATNIVPVTANMPITLPVGTYYFATTNNNVVSATAAYTITSAVGAVGFPRWGTVPAVNGAMPASINPAAITETTGGWMCYVQLSNVTT
jgi:hypothetical protein